MASYLISQGQQVVIEKDGGGPNRIVLIAVPDSESHERRISMHTCTAPLGVLESKVRKGLRDHERTLTVHSRPQRSPSVYRKTYYRTRGKPFLPANMDAALITETSGRHASPALEPPT